MVDKIEIGAFLIVMALLMFASPYALATAFTDTSQYALSLVAVLIFSAVTLVISGVACFYIKPEETTEAA